MTWEKHVFDWPSRYGPLVAGPNELTVQTRILPPNREGTIRMRRKEIADV